MSSTRTAREADVHGTSYMKWILIPCRFFFVLGIASVPLLGYSIAIAQDETSGAEETAAKVTSPERGSSRRQAEKDLSDDAPSTGIIANDANSESDSPENAAFKPLPRQPAPLADVKKSTVRIEPFLFRGLRPGVSRSEFVRQEWGEPAEIQLADDQIHWSYTIEPFDSVDVSFENGAVISLAISLKSPVRSAELRQQLGLSDVEPATILGERDDPIGQVFPERGAIFAFHPRRTTPHVAHVILEIPSADSFALRARERFYTDVAGCLSDLESAFSLDAELPEARQLQAKLYVEHGRYDMANELIKSLAEEFPDDPETQLLHAQLLAKYGENTLPLNLAQRVINLSRDDSILAAEAWILQGDLHATGATRNYRQAIRHHLQATRIATSLAAADGPAVRHRAKSLLVTSHIAVANDIAWGNWRSKDKVVPQWLQRAEEIAHDAVHREGFEQEIVFRVYGGAASAAVGMRGLVDPAEYISAGLELAEQLKVEPASSPLILQKLQWDTGMLLFDAMQLAHEQENEDSALQRGLQAIETLNAAIADGKPTDEQCYLLGRTHFRVGTVYALFREEHDRALEYYKNAQSWFARLSPEYKVSDDASNGEMWVSMAVSYWKTGSQDQALEFTERGVKLMEKAVADGAMSESDLFVPYGNLAAMYQERGDTKRSDEFASMAARIRQPKPNSRG